VARSLTDSVVAVIGAGGGLGTPISAALHARGARLLLAGPHPDRLPDLPAGVTVTLDLRDPGGGDTLVAAATEQFGRLDGLVNAAGVVAFGSLLDTDDAVVEELFLTNVMGPLWLLRRVAPMLIDTKGFVVQLSAVVAEQPLANMAPYAASKAALTAADRAVARELRRVGVSVCDVRPPHTETQLAHHPLAGAAPRLPSGLDPELVAARIVRAIEAGETDVPAAAFADEPEPRT
jgi:cyclic-di-GMP-binding biofilm dispersal mediator protein